jgi:hypothetical protein
MPSPYGDIEITEETEATGMSPFGDMPIDEAEQPSPILSPEERMISGLKPEDFDADYQAELQTQIEQSEIPFSGVAALRGSTSPTTGEPREAAYLTSQISRPFLETGLGIAGASLGTGATPGVGTIAGGGLGYAIGKDLADKLDQFMGLKEEKPLLLEFIDPIIDIPTGAAYEAGGLSLAKAAGPALKFVASKIPIPTKKGTIKAAGEVLAAQTEKGPIIAKNIE